MDACATIIDIKLKDYGLEYIEVSDNGTGVEQSNWETLGLKHHTSKLETFEDLERVTSFGFRGEALSSLCSVAESLHVTTCTKDMAPLGRKLIYDKSGALVSSTSVARNQGTSVCVCDLFKKLPVRYQELKRNIKREYGKCLDILQAYALIR